MALAIKRSFPNATQVIDRFHVEQLASEALQEIRIKHRWNAIDAENDAIEASKKLKIPFQAEVFENGDTLKQLLASSRHLLYKHQNNWSKTQQQRADLLFDKYPDIKKAYELTQQLKSVFASSKTKWWPLHAWQDGTTQWSLLDLRLLIPYQKPLNYTIVKS
jgi:transposase